MTVAEMFQAEHLNCSNLVDVINNKDFNLYSPVELSVSYVPSVIGGGDSAESNQVQDSYITFSLSNLPLEFTIYLILSSFLFFQFIFIYP